MAFKDHAETEKSQLDVLIEQAKADIERFEDDKKKWDEKVRQFEEEAVDEFHKLTSPGGVAADTEVTDAERAAAANQALSQDPQRVNAEQSQPSPSTHSEQFEKSEEQVQAEAEAKADEAAGPKQTAGETDAAFKEATKAPKKTAAKKDDKVAEPAPEAPAADEK